MINRNVIRVQYIFTLISSSIYCLAQKWNEVVRSISKIENAMVEANNSTGFISSNEIT